MENEQTGTVKWFDKRKGYGFIRRENENDIFVHYSAIIEPVTQTLEDGDSVTFVVGEGRKGPAAKDVRRVAD
jgi:CspA family cold shock protein